jgi:hypothetical protein
MFSRLVVPLALGFWGLFCAASLGDECVLPPVASGATAVLVGTETSSRYASAYLDTADGPATFVVDVAVSEEQPLYLVAVAGNRIIWRFSGAVGRLSKVVLIGGQPRGATGVPREKIAFVDTARCLPEVDFNALPQSGFATSVKELLGVDHLLVAGAYALDNVSVPSMRLAATAQISPSGFSAVIVDPHDVTANSPSAAYPVLPGLLGLSQLVGEGSLTILAPHTYRINRPLNHIPADLYGGMQVKLILPEGIPAPTGDLGHSCIVDEAGHPLRSHCAF